MYAINLDENDRVLRATLEEFKDKESILVDKLPEGDLYEYLFENGAFIHSPRVPTEEETKQQEQAEASEGLNSTDYIFAHVVEDLVACDSITDILKLFVSVRKEYADIIKQRKEWREKLQV